MSGPSVCAVLLTRDRPQMTKQAVLCFEAQTYPAKRLVIYDTSTGQANNVITRYRGHYQKIVIGDVPKTIGELRNAANALVHQDEEIIVHLDSDDLSHANRIAEQVALLQASGADCVGYREVLFWRETCLKRELFDATIGGFMGGEASTAREFVPGPVEVTGEAWLYSNPDPRYCIGASLCYTRKAWEKHPFPALPTGPESSSEDNEWLKGVKSVGQTAMFIPGLPGMKREPSMICRVHGGNTMNYSRVMHEGPTWHRVPQWDQYCRERFA